MRAAWVLPAFVLLAACQGGGNSSDNEVSNAEEIGPSSTTGPSTAEVNRRSDTVTARSESGGMRSNVSSLNAAVSDLTVRTTDLAVIVELPTDVLFDFDKATLTAGAQARLREAASYVSKGGEGAITIIGHTDAKGSNAYNRSLSIRRAEAVREWFEAQPSMRGRSFAVDGRGEAEPIASNTRPDGSDDPAGRARNRRVEVVIPR